MAPRASKPNLEVIGVSHGGSDFQATFILAAAFTPPNTLEPSYDRFLKDKKLIPEEAEVWVPTENMVRIDWSSLGWFCLHEPIFRSGGTLPFSPLMTEVLKTVRLMPFQLLPSAWRLVHSVEAICKRHGLEIRLEDLQNHYSLRSHGNGRIMFRVRGKNEALVENLDSGDDKGWAANFMFVRTASLGPEMAYLNYPLVRTVSDWSSRVGDIESEERLRAFLSLDVSERTWPACLGNAALPHFTAARAEGYSSRPSSGIGGEHSKIGIFLELP